MLILLHQVLKILTSFRWRFQVWFLCLSLAVGFSMFGFSLEWLGFLGLTLCGALPPPALQRVLTKRISSVPFQKALGSYQKRHELVPSVLGNLYKRAGRDPYNRDKGIAFSVCFWSQITWWSHFNLGHCKILKSSPKHEVSSLRAPKNGLGIKIALLSDNRPLAFSRWW